MVHTVACFLRRSTQISQHNYLLNPELKRKLTFEMKHEYIQRKYFCSEVELQNIKKSWSILALNKTKCILKLNWSWPNKKKNHIEHHIVMNCHHIMFYLEFNWLN